MVCGSRYHAILAICMANSQSSQTLWSNKRLLAGAQVTLDSFWSGGVFHWSSMGWANTSFLSRELSFFPLLLRILPLDLVAAIPSIHYGIVMSATRRQLTRT